MGSKPDRLQIFVPSGKIVGMANQLPGGLPDNPNTKRAGRPDAAADSPDTPRHFSDETLQSLQELGELLREIHARLISEGYTIQDGKISKNGAHQKNHAGDCEQR